MKVLFLGTSNLLHPWYDDVLKVAAGRWPIPLFDRSQPVAPQFEGLDVVIDQGGNHGTHELIDAASEVGVKLWQVLGTGLDHTDVAYILKKGIPLANTPGQFSSIALAEHALFLMLLFAKKFFESQRSVRNQVLCEPMNEELHGKTLGLLGFGASGRELAMRAKVMGMRIMAIDVVRHSAIGPRTAWAGLLWQVRRTASPAGGIRLSVGSCALDDGHTSYAGWCSSFGHEAKRRDYQRRPWRDH